MEALILGTPQDQLVKPAAPDKAQSPSPENVARMEQEMAALEREFRAVEQGYGENVLHLTLARAYVRKLLANDRVANFLKAGHADMHAEFERIARAETL